MLIFPSTWLKGLVFKKKLRYTSCVLVLEEIDEQAALDERHVQRRSD